MLDDPAGPYAQKVLDDRAANGVEVPAKTFASLAEDFDRIDYLTVDLQGGEEVLIHASLEDLTAKVHYLQLATHSHQIHRHVQSALRSAGWIERFNFPYQRLVLRTPWGPIRFEDGSQAWINPHL